MTTVARSIFLRAEGGHRSADKEEINQISQVGNINSAAAINVGFFFAFGWRATAEEEVHEIGQIGDIGDRRSVYPYNEFPYSCTSIFMILTFSDK